MEHSLAFTAGFNSSLLAFFFLMNTFRCLLSKKFAILSVVNAWCVYLAVSDAVTFFHLN